jgi:Cytidylate kinase-like family
MDRLTAFEHYRGFIDAQLQRARDTRPGAGRHLPVVTISRQCGAGAWVVANELAEILRARTSEPPPWTIFDRNLVQKVLDDHDLPARLAEYMPEDRVSEVSDTMDQLFGLRPSSWTLVRKTADTILRLAEIGNVVVIGRGGSVITSHLDHAFHVRLIGSDRRRIKHIERSMHMDADAAAAYVREEDLARRRYLKKYYGKDIDDPLLYHLVLNTDRVPHGESARLIGEAVSPSTTTGAMATARWTTPGAEVHIPR